MSNIIMPTKPPEEDEDVNLADNCTTCTAFRASVPGSINGGCRADPPAPLMVGLQNTALGPQPIIQNFIPGVGVRDWCRRYERTKEIIQ